VLRVNGSAIEDSDSEKEILEDDDGVEERAKVGGFSIGEMVVNILKKADQPKTYVVELKLEKPWCKSSYRLLV
jgi:hypothetical protein